MSFNPMKKLLPLLLLFSAPIARADLTHRLSTSTQLQVNGAATVSERIGSTYTVSGTNIKVGTGNSDVFGGLTAGSATASATMKAGTYEISTPGSAFSFSESWLQGDGIPAIGSGVDVTSGVVADMPAFGETTTQSGGVAGTLAGTITSAGIMTLTAGGAGTTATGQFVSEIVVD
tara:strand:+ start:14289 stop:14813 length:525 start_codon:yes stop_codon:yes gene_type:complete